MAFKKGDRVELATSDFRGTVVCDDGTHVKVMWDVGRLGNLKYDRSVEYSAHALIRLARVARSGELA